MTALSGVKAELRELSTVNGRSGKRSPNGGDSRSWPGA
jgi:hypothetical protein